MRFSSVSAVWFIKSSLIDARGPCFRSSEQAVFLIHDTTLLGNLPLAPGEGGFAGRQGIPALDQLVTLAKQLCFARVQQLSGLRKLPFARASVWLGHRTWEPGEDALRGPRR